MKYLKYVPATLFVGMFLLLQIITISWEKVSLFAIFGAFAYLFYVKNEEARINIISARIETLENSLKSLGEKEERDVTLLTDNISDCRSNINMAMTAVKLNKQSIGR